MSKIFLQVVEMSVTAGYVVLFVLLGRLVLRRAPKIFSYALWSVVFFRLACPVSFTSAVSLLPSPVAPAQNTAISYNPAPNIGVAAQELINAPAAPPVQIVEATTSAVTVTGVLALVWLAGLAVLLLYSMVSYVRLRGRVAGAACTGGNLYESDAIKTPFVLGLLRPAIYLPVGLAGEERGYILLHEQTHIRRLDYLIKPLAFLLLAVHWFNPLAWVAFLLLCRDMEMSCDEAVLKRLGVGIRGEYSQSLLTMATKGRLVGGSPLAFGESGAGNRIRNVLDYRRPRFWVAAVCCTLVVALVAALAANPVSRRASIDNTVAGWFGGDFAELAKTEHGVYYDWRNNKLIGSVLVEDFISAVEARENGSLLYFVDSTYEPYIYSMRVNKGDDFYTIDRYSQEGAKETLTSQSVYQGDTYYRFGSDLHDEWFPLYLPFGVGSDSHQAKLTEYHDKYLGELSVSGVLLASWGSPETILPERFMDYYTVHVLAKERQMTDADSVEVPGADVEAAIMEHFDLPVRRLRAAVNYDEAQQTYTFANGGWGEDGVQVVNYSEEGDRLTLHYEYYSRSDGTTILRQGELELTVEGEGYKYLSNKVWNLG